MVMSSACWDRKKFARMASVEELDSNLTLLTHHPAMSRRSSMITSQIENLSTAENAAQNRNIQSPIEVFVNAASILTPPGTPYSGRTVSPETPVSQTFDYASQNFDSISNKAKDLISTHIKSAPRFAVPLSKKFFRF
ncbi:unnamed protein product [Enterobius vermicularis]|uniref:Uncharacterized protein n=1 Tax=Enterobius vermicularis TaxID=51028 RepID=A0A0N4V910_ENTVE|nr:unnamed protein product [Enterobius vermicularis]